MYADYISHVLSKYKSGCKSLALSPRLSLPTPGSLRAECVTACTQRFDTNDQQILRMFFGHHDSKKTYIQAIERFDVDKFKPLLNFITGKTSDTSQKNIELLAWLIDVQPRPYRDDYPYENTGPNPEPVPDENKITVDGVELKQEVNQEITIRGPIGSNEAKNEEAARPLKRRRIIVSALLTFLIISAIFILWRAAIPTVSCMYWAGDHYELVDCDRKMGDILVIAADNSKLLNFKKINHPDTITLKALGHVWYSKINNTVEYFTSDGYHPVHIQYHLKPLTQYIIAHHLQQQP